MSCRSERYINSDAEREEYQEKSGGQSFPQRRSRSEVKEGLLEYRRTTDTRETNPELLEVIWVYLSATEQRVKTWQAITQTQGSGGRPKFAKLRREPV